MKPPSVAVPTLITAAVLIPARIVGAASGSSICQRIAMRERPSASADSRSNGGIEINPGSATVLFWANRGVQIMVLCIVAIALIDAAVNLRRLRKGHSPVVLTQLPTVYL